MRSYGALTPPRCITRAKDCPPVDRAARADPRTANRISCFNVIDPAIHEYLNVNGLRRGLEKIVLDRVSMTIM